MDTSSKPFWVVICSVCGKRIHDGTACTDDNVPAVHDECYASKSALTSQKTSPLTVPTNPLGRWRTFATRIIKEAMCVLAEGHN